MAGVLTGTMACVMRCHHVMRHAIGSWYVSLWRCSPPCCDRRRPKLLVDRGGDVLAHPFAAKSYGCSVIFRDAIMDAMYWFQNL